MSVPPVQLHCLPTGYQTRQTGVYQAKFRPDLLCRSLLGFPILCSPSGYIPFQSISFCTEHILTRVCLRATILLFFPILQSGLACSLLSSDRLVLCATSPLGYSIIPFCPPLTPYMLLRASLAPILPLGNPLIHDLLIWAHTEHLMPSQSLSSPSGFAPLCTIIFWYMANRYSLDHSPPNPRLPLGHPSHSSMLRYAKALLDRPHYYSPVDSAHQSLVGWNEQVSSERR